MLCLALVLFPVNALASTASSSIAKSEEVSDDIGKAEIFEASLSQLREMLESGKITSEKLCSVYIERINTYDKDGVKLNSVISINKNALAQAKQLDSERKAGKVRGLLHGIPILVKDNIDVSGFPTTLGKASLKDTVAEADAAAVAALTEQGAIILGKTNLSTDDTATRYTVSSLLGETRNAYNTKFSAGGSSGGSAVAVSANFAAAALGTDTSFSLCYPAALNGIVALRPTHSLIDYTGASSVVKARDTIGPMARSVEDTALLLDIMTDNAQTTPYLKSLSKDALKGKTVAVLKELSQYTYNSPNEWKQSDDEIDALFKKAIEDLKAQGANVVTVSIPKLFTYYNTCRESYSGSAAAKANLLAEVKNVLSQNGAQALIFPAYLSTPLKSGFDEYGSHLADSATYLNCGGYLPSLVGLPAITVPMGYTKDGVGAGLEFVALPNEDSLVLSLSYSYEQATGHRTAPQTVPNLYEVIDAPPTVSQIESESVSSQTEGGSAQNTEKESSLGWQTTTVIVIICATLAFCTWVLIFNMQKDRKKQIHKNRHF